jgi:arylsulfatase A-like enzyme
MKIRALALLFLVTVPVAAGLWWFFDLPGVPDGLRREAAEPAGPVNVVIIAIDTLRADFLSLGGRDWVRDPHITALAADGTWFADCQSTAPWTGPAFASLYTGVLPYRHGFFHRQFYSLGPQNTTMAELFTAAGYTTGAWVTIGYLTHAYGMHQGLQTGEKFDDHADGEAAKKVTAAGVRFTSLPSAPPFLAFLHYYDVHAPYTPPAPYDRMYVTGDPFAPGRPPVLDTVLDPQVNMEAHKPEMYAWLEGVTDPEYPVAQYAAGVSYVDDHVGRVVADLEARGLYDDALIVLVSDHGEHLGEHGIYYGHSLPYREVLHVPLIIKWPGNEHAGTVVTERVSIMDVLPTLLEVTGQEIPPGLDGRSLVGTPEGRGRGASLMVAEQGETPEQYCKTLLEGRWKLMLFWVRGGFVPVLFDVEADPQEIYNVAADHPEVVERMTARIWEIFDPDRPFGVHETKSEQPVDDAELRRLRSLGYIR